MKKISWIIIAIALFLIFHYLIDFFALTSVAKIKIVAGADYENPIKVYYSSVNSRNNFSENRSINSTWITKQGKATHVVHPNNRLVRGLRIDPLQNEGVIKIYSIEILSHFGDSLFFNSDGIVNSFSSRNTAELVREDEFVTIRSTTSDPQLVLKNPVRFHNPLFSYILPISLSVSTILIIKNIKVRQIHAIKDITSKQPSAAKNITALDGLRGFAALLVLADHTGFEYFKGLGAIGVWIFFCLSGFLLSIPFVKSPSLITSTSYLQHYFIRRIKRIVPMYYFILTIVYFFRGNLESFFRHLIFIQGDGIFWSVPQEMFFYMILPLVFILNYFVCRGKIKFMLISTLALTVLLNHYLSTDWLYIYGNGRKLSLVPGVFILGIALSYFYHSPYCSLITNRSRLLHDLCGIVLLIIVLLSSDSFLNSIFNKGINYSWNNEIYGYVAALLLFFTISRDDSLLNKIMSSFPLRAVGIVGFSFYLIHVSVLNAINTICLSLIGQEPGYVVLLVTGIVITYFFSLITYSLIERPFMIKTS